VTSLKVLLQNILLCIFHISISVTLSTVLIPRDIRHHPHRFPLPEGMRDAKERENPGDILLVVDSVGGGCLQPTVFSREPLITRARVKGL